MEEYTFALSILSIVVVILPAVEFIELVVEVEILHQFVARHCVWRYLFREEVGVLGKGKFQEDMLRCFGEWCVQKVCVGKKLVGY